MFLEAGTQWARKILFGKLRSSTEALLRNESNREHRNRTRPDHIRGGGEGATWPCLRVSLRILRGRVSTRRQTHSHVMLAQHRNY